MVRMMGGCSSDLLQGVVFVRCAVELGSVVRKGERGGGKE